MTDQAKRTALIAEAGRWVGVHERSPNDGPEIEIFQKAIGGAATRQSWCADFALYCVEQADKQVGLPKTWLFISQSCLSIWNKSPLTTRVQGLAVQPGDLMIWQHYTAQGPTTEGHIGIIEKVLGPGEFQTIEGNTSESTADVDREGDGVYRKVRSAGGSSMMRVKGFLRVWKPG